MSTNAYGQFFSVTRVGVFEALQRFPQVILMERPQAFLKCFLEQIQHKNWSSTLDVDAYLFFRKAIFLLISTKSCTWDDWNVIVKYVLLYQVGFKPDIIPSTYVAQVYPELLKRLDDSNDKIRVAVCEACFCWNHLRASLNVGVGWW